MKRLYIFIPWIIVFALLLTSCSLYDSSSLKGLAAKPAARSTETSLQLEQKIKVPDFSLKDINGKTVKLSDYAGKVVLLNFWATWCPYCIREMPELDRLNSELAKDNKAVILTIDVGESADRVKKYITEKKYTLTALVDNEGSVAENYGITGLPTTIVVDRDGTLYDTITGATDAKTLLDIVNKLKR